MNDNQKNRQGWYVYVEEQFPRLGFVIISALDNKTVEFSIVSENGGDTELYFPIGKMRRIKEAIKWAIYHAEKSVNEPVSSLTAIFTGQFQNENDGSGVLIVQVLNKGVIQLAEVGIDDDRAWICINIEIAEKIIARLDEAIAIIAHEQK